MVAVVTGGSRGIGKAIVKFTFKCAVGRKGKALFALSGGIQLNQVLGNVLGGAARLLLGALPFGAAKP